jgi:sulfonate transport system ATP-binding protein
MQSAISINIETMRYPDMEPFTNLIQRLCIEVKPNAFVSLLGRTGAGKTTLLRMVAGLERRFAGSIQVSGNSVVRPTRDIQLVFQDYRLFPWKTVYDNIAFATSSRKDPAERARVEKWLDIVGLRGRQNAWPKTLSGGETWRVAFARAFIDQPKVLLLDEPFRGLDLVTKFGLQEELRSVLEEQRTTVVMVSHSIDDAVFLSDSVYVLSEAPMRVETIFHVDSPRPRQRGDARLVETVGLITRHLAGKPK